MRHIFSFSLFLFAVLVIGCSKATTTEPKQEVTDNSEESQLLDPPMIILSNVSKPVLFDYTSTGCPGCGSWGGPTFESIIGVEKNNIVPMAVHIKYGDKMITEVSEAIAGNRTGQYFTPQLWVNNTNGVLLSGGRINASGSLAKLNDEINAVQEAASEIQVGVSHALNDSKVAVRFKTKPNADLNGQYYLGVYLMENGITDRQSGNPNGSKDHNHVIRASNSGGFGTQIQPENLTLNSENTGVIEFEMKDDWDMKNLYAAIIVWKVVGNNYVVVNANNNLIL